MFDRLTGNKRAKDLLTRMLQAGRVPGALIFVGIEGIGKKLFAIELTKALNCLQTEDGEACDQCAACVRIERFKFASSNETEDNKSIIWSAHPDVGLLRADGRAFKVDQVRELEAETHFRPYEGKRRVFILDEADKLNEASSNALLKTLEELPATSHLFLITSRHDALLPTIRSRCQTIRFAPLSADEIEKHLLQNNKRSPQDARSAAALAAGSLASPAVMNLDECRAGRSATIEILAALAGTKSRAPLLRAAEEWSDPKRKDEYEAKLGILEMLARDVWLLSLGANSNVILNADLREQLLKIAARVSSSRQVADWLAHIENTRQELSININRRIATDALFLRMAND